MLDGKDIGIRKLESVIKTQFLWLKKPQISFKKNQHFHSDRASFIDKDRLRIRRHFSS